MANQADTSGSGGSPLVWLGGVAGAVFLAILVGVGVYFYMSAEAARSMDELVNARVAEQAEANAKAPQGPPPASVKVALVKEKLTQKRIPVVGRLMEVKRATIASEVEGRVLELLTPAGRELVGGETVIARVDSVWSNLAVVQAEADLAAAQATARQSENERKRYEQLAARGSADPQELEDARATADVDAARVQSLEAVLQRARETRKRVEIIAPFDATVTKKLTEKGQWLAPGSGVVEIVSRGLIDAVIDVPEEYISALSKGSPIQVTIEPVNQTINGEVVAINPDGSNPARTYPVKVRFDDRDGLFKVGMSVTASVPVQEQAKYMVVPRDAVQYAENGPQVWMSLVMPGSAPESLPQGIPMDVDVLFGDGDQFAVRPKPKMQGMDLRPGMEVVVEGAERLWPTRPLMIKPSGDGPEKPEAKQSASGVEADRPAVAKVGT